MPATDALRVMSYDRWTSAACGAALRCDLDDPAHEALYLDDPTDLL